MNAESIGYRLKKIREEAGLSMRAFGEVIGYSASYVSQIEKGNREIPARAIELISVKFGIEPAWLKTGDGPRHPVSDPALNGAIGGRPAWVGGALEVSEREKRLVLMFRHLSAADQGLFYDQIAGAYFLELENSGIY